jgi:prepilin-type N-terminal cleavage/methylation domain-containing protein
MLILLYTEYMNMFYRRFSNNCSFSSGFTLVEVVIVLSILALLTTTSVLGYTHFLKNARDSRRQVDLNTVSTVLQEYRKNTGTYPDDLDELTSSSPPYIEELPEDPKNPDPDYGYTYVKTGNTYTLSALLENGEYYVINPYGSDFMAANPQNVTPTPTVAFPTRTPTPTPPDVEFVQTYKYYADLYLKSHPWGDLVHYQYSNLILANVSDSPAHIKIYLKKHTDGSNLLTTGNYIEKTLQPKELYNSWRYPGTFFGLDPSDSYSDNGNIKTETDTSTLGNHKSAIGWIEVVSDKPLAGHNRIVLFDGPDITDDNIIAVEDEPLAVNGHKKYYQPLYFHDVDTRNSVYKQFTDLNILNPFSQPTNITIDLRDDVGSLVGSFTHTIPARSRWTSWGKSAWLNLAGSDIETDGATGSLEITSDTTDVFVSVRQRITETGPGSNSYPAIGPPPDYDTLYPEYATDDYFAHHVLFDDEQAIPWDQSSTEMNIPIYLKEHTLDGVTDTLQWTDLSIVNIENTPANVSIDVYRPSSGGAVYDSVGPITIPAYGRWNSYLSPEWNGIPNMTDAGWLTITSNRKLVATNRTTAREPGTAPVTSSNTTLRIFDDEPVTKSTKTSTKMYETFVLRNIGAEGAGSVKRQYTNPVLINMSGRPATVELSVQKTDGSGPISTLYFTIDPYDVWHSFGQDEWKNLPSTWYGSNPPPNPQPDRTQAWAEITSTEPLFGMHRLRFHKSNEPDPEYNATPDTELLFFDDDTDVLFRAEDIFACVNDTDCDGNLVCTENECVLP